MCECVCVCTVCAKALGRKELSWVKHKPDGETEVTGVGEGKELEGEESVRTLDQ